MKLCRALADAAAEVTTTAERALLAGLGVGCRTPVAGHATLAEGRLTLTGLVGRPDASEMIREALTGAPADAAAMGAELAAPPAGAWRRSDPARAGNLAVQRTALLVKTWS